MGVTDMRNNKERMEKKWYNSAALHAAKVG